MSRRRARPDHSPDAGRRVLQCSICERVLAYRGDDVARARGWGSRWVDVDGELRRTWACRTCYVPPAPPAPPALTVPGYLAQLLAGLGGPRYRGAAGEALAREQVELLAAEQPERWAAVAGELAALLSPAMRARWAKLLKPARVRRRAA